ncbi:MAG: DNA polymerase III subunit alpha [Candidatus Marinimicrobia bacterium]|nr:DNA polymerase III subunit alpha [Candidatus Neomarinimicrobiota bacterium]
MAEFVHLHNHSDFSLLDAAQTIEMMCNRLDDLGMDTIALTEHGNLFSMIPFYKAANKRHIKPILGCEIYVSMGNHKDRKQSTDSAKKWGYHHLILLVQNETGYKNLMKLVSIGYLEGFYYRPRVDKELLRQYNEGLIATSACLAGELTYHASLGNYDRAKAVALEFQEIFPNRYYIELQNHGIPEEIASHPILIKLSKELEIPLVATNDNHYSVEENWKPHDVLFCLGTGKDLSDTNRRQYEPRQFYVKSADEMWKLFKDTPTALENTLRIAESCSVNIDMTTLHLPHFKIPEGETVTDADEYLKKLCVSGLKERYSKITTEIQARLTFELSVIKKMNFANYFLITQDFVAYARSHNIPVGPGRGSAAGSLVAYTTGITNVDPIKYNLLFERFLNPGRVSMPDIDIDFCIEGREQVINYIRDLYGHESVAQIITFGRMKTKSVIRDVGRVLGLPYGDVDRIAKMIPNDPSKKLPELLRISKDLAGIADISETHKNLIDYSSVLEGMHRHASTHAAGVVIAPGPLVDYVPLYKSPNSKDIVTQVEMNSLEEMGLLKVDFLGLRNLTVIAKAVKMIDDNHGIKVDIDNINLEEEKVYQLFVDGNTVGIFQFESKGMREYLLQLKPTCLQDLIAMNALYRPGPMGNIPEFIARKHGHNKIEYIHPDLEPILKETYGIIVYQEQVMQISSTIAGFTLAQADEMRRAMGKKKADMMAAFRLDFISGAIENKMKEGEAKSIYDHLEKFAQYGFNKSHSTAYAIVAYQTAWLKTFYPAEFIAANLTTEMENLDRVVILIEEAKNMGVAVHPPDVNTSFSDFRSSTNGEILFGLSAVKNVGHKVTECIAETRERMGNYASISDLCKNIEPHVMNRKALESLIGAGACDSLVGTRAQNFASVESALSFGTKFNQDQDTQQVDIFGSAGVETIHEPELADAEPWTQEECQLKEKEVLGFYLSGHPLEKYKEELVEFSTISMEDPDPNHLPNVIRIGGIISDVKPKLNKKNQQWAIVELSGISGKMDIFVFNEVYERMNKLIVPNELVFIEGTPYRQNGEENTIRISAKSIIKLSRARKEFSNNINIRIPFKFNENIIVDELQAMCSDNQGWCKLVFHVERSDGSTEQILSRNTRVSPVSKFLLKLRTMVGKQNVWIS